MGFLNHQQYFILFWRCVGKDANLTPRQPHDLWIHPDLGEPTKLSTWQHFTSKYNRILKGGVVIPLKNPIKWNWQTFENTNDSSLIFSTPCYNISSLFHSLSLLSQCCFSWTIKPWSHDSKILSEPIKNIFYGHIWIVLPRWYVSQILVGEQCQEPGRGSTG